jgi:leader peptidase (prepilin peptidase)/N-methyltransferase
LTGIAGLSIWLNFGFPWAFFYFAVFCVLLCIFIIDINHQIIPDKLNIYLLLLFLAYAIINLPLYYWLIGIALGFGATYFITWLFYKLRGVVGLGGGDIKLFGVLGVYLGPQIIYTLFYASFFGALFTGAWMLVRSKNKNTPFAFGPYIVLVAAIQIFFPDLFSLINVFNY